MQHSPSLENGSSSASQEIPCLLPNSKVHYHIHNSLPLVPVLSQINSDHVPTRLPSGLFPSDFLNKTLYAPVLSSIHSTCPTNLILLNLITWIIQSSLLFLQICLLT